LASVPILFARAAAFYTDIGMGRSHGTLPSFSALNHSPEVFGIDGTGIGTPPDIVPRPAAA
jgi:hypothetical protein